MTGNELFNVDTFIFGLLNGDATLQGYLGGTNRVYAEAAPQGTAAPFIIVGFQSNTDTTVIGAVRIISRPLYVIKAVTQENTWSNAGLIASRVDALLMGSRGSAGGNSISCEGREQLFRYWEMDEGLRWNYMGGLYRFFVS